MLVDPSKEESSGHERIGSVMASGGGSGLFYVVYYFWRWCFDGDILNLGSMYRQWYGKKLLKACLKVNRLV